jgi:hypothetical protein
VILDGNRPGRWDVIWSIVERLATHLSDLTPSCWCFGLQIKELQNEVNAQVVRMFTAIHEARSRGELACSTMRCVSLSNFF